jgi:hypothetical protein
MKNNTARKRTPALTPQLRPSNIIQFPGTKPIPDPERDKQFEILRKAAPQFQALLDLLDKADTPSFDLLENGQVIWSVERRVPRD